MDPYFNFNITSGMSFEGIDFTGAEAAASYNKTHYPPPNRIATPKCEVSKDPIEQLLDPSNDNFKTIVFKKNADVE